jgi:hypothetical protein
LASFTERESLISIAVGVAFAADGRPHSGGVHFLQWTSPNGMLMPRFDPISVGQSSKKEDRWD